MSKICLIYNYAQHYRTNIFTLFDKALNIDFVFGDHYLNVKKMDYSLLSHPVKEVKNMNAGPFEWQKGVIGLLFKGYKKFIILGEPKNLSTWLLLIWGRLMRKEIYFWTHGWYGRESKTKSFVKKVFFGMANGTLLYGEYARNLMINKGFNPAKLTTIHNSLLYDEQLPIRKNLSFTGIYKNHFRNTSPTIIFVGRLTAIKKLHLIIEAQNISRKNGINFNVALVGDGSELIRLKNLVQESKLDQMVWFYGPTYNESELSQLIYEADICVAPGNIGLTAMHAMVYGCPCISHNDFKWQMPEFEAIHEGVTGTFFERDNSESLAESIMSWLVLHKDDREQVRKACYKEIDENWNPHRQLEIIMKAIGEQHDITYPSIIEN